MQKISYYFVRYIVFLFSFTPFWLLYLISDFFSFVLFNIIPYRKKIVLKNLQNSFPNKSEKEINSIAKKFYKHLTDILLESVKGFTLSDKKILKRYKYEESKVVTEYFKNKKNIILAGAHYGNWEWGILMISHILPFKMYGIYKPMSNKYVDKYIKKLRTKRGTELVPMKLTNRIFKKESDEIQAIMLVGDQSPSDRKKALWVKFLNQDTACIHGIELYAKIYKLPVVYYSIGKEKRGHYKITAELIMDDPRKSKKGEITHIFMKKLENTIKKTPELWLWSHKRWKHKLK